MTHLRAWLQLTRLPAVFTAMADVALGYVLTHSEPAADGSLVTFSLLLACSSCLYLAGMTFNDVFDRRIDAVERPARPIPSGRVPLRSAVALGAVLMLAGLVAATVAGTSSVAVAAILTACILAYDGGIKATPAGPLLMGSCRFLNVLLGASHVAGFELVWKPPQLGVALALGAYVTGLTWLARSEARTSDRRHLIGAAVIANLGLVALVVLVLLYPWANEPDLARRQAVFLVLAVIMLTINRRVTAAIVTPSPERVQTAVRTMILSLIMLDASLILVASNEMLYAALTAALIVPALTLGRFIYVT